MAGISGNDDSFIAFCFAIVTLIMMFLYFPVLIGIVAELYRLVTTGSTQPKRKKTDDDEPVPKPNWRILFDDFTEVPRTAIQGLRNLTHVTAGAHILREHRDLARTVFLGDTVRMLVRPRFIFLCLWLVLLSSAMYASITFDPHAALGVPTTATTAEIKRAYRKLSKINHPDHNKTDSAKVIYNQVRKAYKALVDRDAFDKDVEMEEMSVGIGLPGFLTNRDNDVFVLFGLLAILLGLPALVWYKFTKPTQNQFQKRLQTAQQLEEQLEPLYVRLGIPMDPKWIEWRRERQELALALTTIGLLPVADPHAVAMFPPLADFKRLCTDPARNANALLKIGLPPPTFEMLREFFSSYQLQDKIKLPEGEFVKVDRITYETLFYITQKTIARIEYECNELTKDFGRMVGTFFEFQTVQKLNRLHAEFFSKLKAVYTEQKPNAKDVKFLVEMPQRSMETFRDIPKELNAIVAHLQQQAQHQDCCPPPGQAPAAGARGAPRR